MADIEKVIKGLECCNNRNDCKQCPYATEYDPNLDCIDKTRADAIELLKEQNGLMLALEQSNASNESLNNSLSALEEIINILKDEIKRLKEEKTKAFDYLFSKIEGHSNYHGDSILCVIECVKEGKKIKTVKTMDEKGEQR